MTLDAVPLTAGRLACACCGVSTAPPGTPGAETCIEVTTAYSPFGHPVRTTSVALGLCDVCSDLSARALALANAHPVMLAQLGEAGGVDAAEGVLVATLLLGITAPDPAVSDAELGSAVRHLASCGLALRWRSHLATSPKHVDRATPYPFAHITESDRHRLRTGYAATLADRLARAAPPAQLVPPPFDAEATAGSGQTVAVPAGCLVCGVGAVTMPATEVLRLGGRDNAARSVWSMREAVDPGPLGGHSSPVTLTGWTCPTCTDAIQSVNAIGPTALERSLRTTLHLGQGSPDSVSEVTGLIGWGALIAHAHAAGTPSPAPNAQPWQHLGDLDELRRRLGGAATR